MGQHSHAAARRRFLRGAAAAAATTFAAVQAPPALAAQRRLRHRVRVASNQGAENATLQQLLVDRGFARDLSLEVEIVESRSISAPMEALLRGDADICMISGFVGVLPAIEQGQALRLVGAAMQLPALAVYTGNDQVRRVADLAGRTVGVGGNKGLLHVLMLALLRKHGVDAASVKFVNAGSNAEVLEAVLAGKVDAGPSGIAGLSGARPVRVLDDGRLWLELPEYTYQPAYASVRALQENPQGLARCMAAYTRLYRYLSGPRSETAYLDARRRATGEASDAEGTAVWRFIRQHQPYALQPGISAERVAWLQQLNLAVGLQSRALPFGQVADLGPARGARTLLG